MNEAQVTGELFVVSAPSGAGKTSLVKALVPRLQALHIPVGFSVSLTTRPMRPGEVNGEDYHFVDQDGFRQAIAANQLLEHAEVFGNFYGTGREDVEALRVAGQHVILEIDWQGAAQVKARAADAISIFILPPSVAELERRLHGRGQDSEAVIAGRLAEARADISHYDQADYVIVNDDFEVALEQLVAIFQACSLRQNAQAQRHAQLLSDLLPEAAGSGVTP